MIARRTPEQQAADFIAANARSPVIAGAALHVGGEGPDHVVGVTYTLKDLSKHRLSREAVKLLPGVPRWDLPKEPA